MHQLIKKLLHWPASADVAIVFVGTDEKTATEEADRLTLLLPGNQVELIKAVAAVNPNTIVVMQTLGCVEVEEFKNLQNVPGIIWTGYNGQAQGDAIASILFGDVNPGGKLNATWYKSVKDLPDITDYNSEVAMVKTAAHSGILTRKSLMNSDMDYPIQHSNTAISRSVRTLLLHRIK